ncbi:hypothetical protein AC801_17070 [Xanthomonas sp. ISO98C4]|nr:MULTISPECIES: hypothetical protein [Xanthomonas]AZU31513.1 hypothetical protein AC801_17070 [Xanthomonas sp. ISO98C4]
MSPQIDLRVLGPQFAMLVYLIQGEQDLGTSAHISTAYFDGSCCTEQGMPPAATHRTRSHPPMMDAQLNVLNRIRAAALANDAHWNTQGVR